MSEPCDRAGPYIFGASTAETQRLLQLGELLQSATGRALARAGIAEGMRVLDIGCGPGSVSLLAAELAGPTGYVVGIDRNPAMLATARARAQACGKPNVTFIEADLGEIGAEGWLEPGFDAVVGRLILLHLEDPVAVLRSLVPHLHTGGVVAFQEPDLTRMGASFPPLPTLVQLCELVRQAHRGLGIDIQFGLRLQHVFEDAGLPSPRLHCEAFIGSGPAWGWYDQMVQAARNALPVVLSHGVATPEESGIEALEEQLRSALACQRSVTRAIDLISAWTHRMPNQ